MFRPDSEVWILLFEPNHSRWVQRSGGFALG